MIVIDHISKKYGQQVAVDDLSFQVKPGVVTGFLGPNGAGKSTTMRMIIGLDRPDSGQITIDGRRYAEHRAPIHEVGALLEAKAVHPARSARNHLLAVAATTGVSTRRVDEVLDLVGLTGAARRRAGDFSLGMSQRLGIAGALLADPQILLFDEPVNGLDPEGILWIRGLLGRTRRAGPHGVRVLPPDHRTRGGRRAPGDHRARSADRRDPDVRARRRGRAAGRARPLTAGRRAGRRWSAATASRSGRAPIARSSRSPGSTRRPSAGEPPRRASCSTSSRRAPSRSSRPSWTSPATRRTTPHTPNPLPPSGMPLNP